VRRRAGGRHRRDAAPDAAGEADQLRAELAAVKDRLLRTPVAKEVDAAEVKTGALAVKVDISKEADVTAMVEQTVARFGSVDIPVARDDLTVPTVRLGIAQLLEATLSSREIDLVNDTVPILLRADSQGLPLGPLTILEILFPGRLFSRSTAALTFRVSSATPLNPASSPWPSITQAPEMLPGIPAY
jgi:NAD(P)-dependent dehydrogenase (short-subunit alcohol dehydrogenase family)